MEALCQQPINALNMSLRMRLSGNKLLFSRLLKRMMFTSQICCD
ncbi:hypothetical protein HMPREF0971_00854 [Segatella oris F0302]|uniref:Uncharacterized protein n=1 Tax=Segatella oris F0302 TaxID=649760 RepID=D1QPG4_9BACT|nr:hypothetical protein HMPREF0971_00854 [Segatella oris F0302]